MKPRELLEVTRQPELASKLERGLHVSGFPGKDVSAHGSSFLSPVGRARERNEEAIRRWRHLEWPAIKETQTEGSTIIFIDHSGISQRPDRVRAWSRHGETPVLQNNFNWDTLSAATGITFHNFYFRRYKATVKSAESWTIFRPYSAAFPDRC